MSEPSAPVRHFRHLDFITAAFVAIMIISNIASVKALVLGPFTFDGGTLLFPLAYIFGDILTEVYGYARSRRVIWTGFFWCGVGALVLFVVDALPPAPEWTLQQSFHAVLGQTPRIVSASLVAYWAGEFTNSYVLAKMKCLCKGSRLWMRTIGSTIAGESVDTGLFLSLAFLGVFPGDLMLKIFLSNIVFKIGVEVLFTPVTYAVVDYLKRAEREDHYDWNTDFNPFRLD